MNEGEARPHGLDPAGMPARQIGGGIIGRTEQAKAVGRQRGGHDRSRRGFIDLLPGGADPEPNPADPGRDPRAVGQLAGEQRQHRGGRLADIKDAEVRPIPGGQLREQARRKGRGVAFGEGGGEGCAHDGPPISRAT